MLDIPGIKNAAVIALTQPVLSDNAVDWYEATQYGFFVISGVCLETDFSTLPRLAHTTKTGLALGCYHGSWRRIHDFEGKAIQYPEPSIRAFSVS